MNERPLFEIAEHALALDGPDQQDGHPVGAAPRPPHRHTARLRLVIHALPEGFLLVSQSSGHPHLDGDTWHPTLEEAFAQAAQQFGTSADQWKRVGD
ncbi:hypothetical protein FKV24_005020 [Lysobacter maris]|uniref:Uncharacterized protein n=1 Tax=Marilutibacter maris TaxID=1605891 RepID=A0A508B7T9_9GAMM|nr:hypothetical protein [Lysobacter maris]KAB8195634.1 hypothetical protein FKV24_005020 [Lysobacter maris]